MNAAFCAGLIAVKTGTPIAVCGIVHTSGLILSSLAPALCRPSRPGLSRSAGPIASNPVGSGLLALKPQPCASSAIYIYIYIYIYRLGGCVDVFMRACVNMYACVRACTASTAGMLCMLSTIIVGVTCGVPHANGARQKSRQRVQYSRCAPLTLIAFKDCGGGCPASSSCCSRASASFILCWNPFIS